MTPEETALLVDAWNQHQGEDAGFAPPSRAEIEELRKRYG